MPESDQQVPPFAWHEYDERMSVWIQNPGKWRAYTEPIHGQASIPVGPFLGSKALDKVFI